MTDEALPPSSEVSAIRGAAKYAQIGPLAAQHIMSAMLTGANLDGMRAVLWIDLHLKVGETLIGFFNTRNIVSTSQFFIGFCDDQTEAQWVHQSTKEFIIQKVKDKEWTCPKGLQAQVDPDTLEPFPPKPQMQLLVFGGADGDELQIPIELVRQWQQHKQFGDEFKLWLNGFLEDYGVAADAASAVDAVDQANPKRKEPPKGESPSKKKFAAQLGPEFIVVNDVIKEMLLHESKIKDDVWLQVRVPDTIYITNKGTTEAILSTSDQVALFGKGKFKMLKPAEELMSNMIEFKIAGANQIVIINNVAQTILKIMNEQRAVKPDSKLCYHKIEGGATGPTPRIRHCFRTS